jgi:G3E family GTPase
MLTMKTTIVCGLLGAGKTTYLQNALRNTTEKVVVIVNDFGSVGIDQEILSAHDIDAVELPNGCVCCTLKHDLLTTIQRVVGQYHPEHLMIEPSGLAAPTGVLEVLQSLEIRPVSVVGIVDATEFLELYEAEIFGPFFQEQVCYADLILVNKTDLAEPEKVEGTLSFVSKMNPKAVVVPTVMAETKIAALTPASNADEQKSIKGGGHSLNLETIAVEMPDKMALDRATEIFQALASNGYGRIVRAKALLQTDAGPYRFDLAGGCLECVEFPKPVTSSRLVVIGENLDQKMLLGLGRPHKR